MPLEATMVLLQRYTNACLIYCFAFFIEPGITHNIACQAKFLNPGYIQLFGRALLCAAVLNHFLKDVHLHIHTYTHIYEYYHRMPLRSKVYGGNGLPRHCQSSQTPRHQAISNQMR